MATKRKLETHEARTRATMIKLTPSEYEGIEQAAAAERRTVSDFIRVCVAYVLDNEIKP